ncbi:type II toxin-antitoxin system HipA family toxin [Auraticoccus monumenti]|uniref:type II toxin-antitoxin system HipA family toxin n=1 Tax=Auraticoccus monumenti TaxID=675864 RepID=UPI0015614F74|nr:HipA domain-containing protein [Auraticoccus monumenti]
MKAGTVAASLSRTSDGVVFRYEPSYLAAGGPPVATTLPLTDEPVLTPGRSVPPFFANLLPEGRRLTALRRHVKTSADDDMTLLLASGADPVGDVQVLPTGADAADADPTATAPALDPVDSWADLDFGDLLRRAGVGDPSSLAGVQDKASGRMLTLPLAWRDRTVLLKFEVPEHPHVVENEAWFLHRARRLRHPVVRAEVVHDRTGRPGLLVTRFDRRVGTDGTLTRLAVEDGAQLLGRYPADKYAVSTEEVAERLAAVCGAPLVALRQLLIQVVYAWLTGNGDLHAKNVSVLRADGEWRTAPVYDVPATVCYGDDTMALPVGGRLDGLSRRSFLELGSSVGLPARAVGSVLDHVLGVTAGMVEELAAGAVPLDQFRRTRLVRTLRHRRRSLEG